MIRVSQPEVAGETDPLVLVKMSAKFFAAMASLFANFDSLYFLWGVVLTGVTKDCPLAGISCGALRVCVATPEALCMVSMFSAGSHQFSPGSLLGGAVRWLPPSRRCCECSV